MVDAIATLWKGSEWSTIEQLPLVGVGCWWVADRVPAIANTGQIATVHRADTTLSLLSNVPWLTMTSELQIAEEKTDRGIQSAMKGSDKLGIGGYWSCLGGSDPVWWWLSRFVVQS